ncbi:unnamed protein product [Paramecium octaurelia]|uniref:Uncharacterized protein n=1 Tax=Paramecium octaurelia TaxID=43137 RepID=A0A8S1XGV2_PAROT|nr:unnamed protein product [Paramecium octaurelia]
MINFLKQTDQKDNYLKISQLNLTMAIHQFFKLLELKQYGIILVEWLSHQFRNPSPY